MRCLLQPTMRLLMIAVAVHHRLIAQLSASLHLAAAVQRPFQYASLDAAPENHKCAGAQGSLAAKSALIPGPAVTTR